MGLWQWRAVANVENRFARGENRAQPPANLRLGSFAIDESADDQL
jgi:hypothetical protein